MNIIIDRFSCVDDLPKYKQNYVNIKALVLRNGRFSVGDALCHPMIFERICKDPEVETFDMEFPWKGIRLVSGSESDGGDENNG